MNRVLITGGSGLIGRRLAELLVAEGYQTRLLSRTGKKIEPFNDVFTWDLKRGYLEPGALEDVDVVVHLAGAGIADSRWTESRKHEIISSRVDTLELIRREAKENGIQFKTLVSGSATGWYGAITDEKLHIETEDAAKDFLGETCKLWEAAADDFGSVADRVVKIRTGVVLSNISGALPRIILPFKFYSGTVLGTGKQQIPWIHLDDICGIYLHAIKTAGMSGAYNAVATEECSNRKFTQAAGKVLHRPVLPGPVPSFAIKLLYGEMGNVVLEGCRVSNEKIKNAGYRFRFEELSAALEDLLK
ncbi:MAG: TIGR01777 family oxidoreductase [Bacteroidia bacterium]